MLLVASACASPRVAPPLADVDTPEWTQLFNGRDLADWTPKFTGHPLGVNYNETFRVEEGLLKVGYDRWTAFGGAFGHLFYRRRSFSHYVISVEYRFVGAQLPGLGQELDWAIRNNGIMLHAQPPETMALHQDFPISLEIQLLGGLADGRERPTASLCTPGTHVVMGGALVTEHCTRSTSRTYHGDQWVRVDALVLGDSIIRHVVNGDTVLTYTRPQMGEGQPLTGGYIALQAETAPTDFRKVALLNLEGCTDPEAVTYKRYYVKSDSLACFYAAARVRRP